MSVLNRESMRSRKRKQKQIDFDDGSSVIVRALKAGEAEEIWNTEGKESTRANIILFAMAVVDESGANLFDHTSEKDLQEIRDLDFGEVLTVVRVVSELSGLRKADNEESIKN